MSDHDLSPSSRSKRSSSGTIRGIPGRSKSSDGAPPAAAIARASASTATIARASASTRSFSGPSTDATDPTTPSRARSTRALGSRSSHARRATMSTMSADLSTRSTSTAASTRSEGRSTRTSTDPLSTRSAHTRSLRQHVVRSSSGSPNTTAARRSPRKGQASDKQRRVGSTNSLAALGVGDNSRRSPRRTSISSMPAMKARSQSSGNIQTAGNIDASMNIDASASSHSSQRSSGNAIWHSSLSSNLGAALGSPRGKRTTRPIPPRVKSLGRASVSASLGAGSSHNRRASVSAALQRMPSQEGQAQAVAAVAVQQQPNLSPNTISNFHANLMRPSSFSTSSSPMARQFLEEDASQVEQSQHMGEVSQAESYVHDLSESAEAMNMSVSLVSTGAAAQGIASITGSSDLEWNPEAQRQQQEEWRSFQRRGMEAQQKANTASRNFPQRPDLREVDQTVNLMDASNDGDYENLMAPSTAADRNRRGNYYDTNNTNNRTPTRNYLPSLRENTGFFSTMSDLFFDEHSDSSSNNRRGKKRRGRKKKKKRKGYRDTNCCQDLCCSKMTLVLLVASLLGAFIAWRTGAFRKVDSGDSDSTPTPEPQVVIEEEAEVADHTEEAADQAFTAEKVEAGAASDGVTSLDSFREMLLELDVSTSEALGDSNSPQYLALNWITQLDDPTLLCVSPPNDDAELDMVLLEAYALAVLYYEANGHVQFNSSQAPYQQTIWRDNTNWMRPTPVCHWHGLDCEGETHIVHLNMSRNNLKGSLPRELKVLSDLRTLDFARCGFQGSLPDDIWPHMTQLEYLHLNQNELTGSLPSTVGNMTRLRSLRLFQNEMEGTLPAELNNMTSLLDLSLNDNKFSGSIPYLAHLKDLEMLRLQDNKLSKHIPFEIFRFLKLRELRVEKNYLTGTVPPEMQSMRELRIFALDNNQLSGSLDNIYDRFDYLEELRLQANQFVGTIPPTFGHLTVLKHLSIDHNDLTGTIPTELARMTSLTEARLYFNHLEGELPLEICALKEQHALEFLGLDCASKITGCTEGNGCCDRCL